MISLAELLQALAPSERSAAVGILGELSLELLVEWETLLDGTRAESVPAAELEQDEGQG